MPDPSTYTPRRTIRMRDAEWARVEEHRQEEGLPSRSVFFTWLLTWYEKERGRK